METPKFSKATCTLLLSQAATMNSSALKPFHQQNPLLSSSKTLTPPKTLTLKPPLHSSNPQSSPRCCSIRTPQQSPLLSLLRPAAVTLTATASLLLFRLPDPSLASPLPIPTSQSQTLTEDETDIDAETQRSLADPRALRSLLDRKIKSNKLYDAVSVIDRLIELQPDDADLPLLKSHILIQSGDVESARHFIEQVIDKDPLSVEAYNGLVMACREAGESLDGVLERVEKAMEVCKKSKRKEDLRVFKLLKAEIKVCQGKYEEAIRVYEELVKEEPRDFRPYLCEGLVYTLMRKNGEAEKKFEKYRRLVPKGHPYAGYFSDNVIAMKVFGQLEENRRSSGLKI